MSFSTKTIKMLWGRSGNRCAMCKTLLYIDSTETDDETLIGDMCHIVGKSIDGPRGISPLTPEQRDKYNNLILLCKNHHKIIDSQPESYPIERLNQFKREHENWVNITLQPIDLQKILDEEVYATIVDYVFQHAHIDKWKSWSYTLMAAGNSHIDKEIHNDIANLNLWIFSRNWPVSNPILNNAFTNLRLVLSDLLQVFNQHSKDNGAGTLYFEKFYKLTWHKDPQVYDRLAQEYDYKIDLVSDLVAETARALNHLCQIIRNTLVPSFRVHDSVFTVDTGMCEDLKSYTYRPHYSPDEVQLPIPYQGLQSFESTRKQRDVFFGR